MKQQKEESTRSKRNRAIAYTTSAIREIFRQGGTPLQEELILNICAKHNVSERKAQEYLRIAQFNLNLDARFNTRTKQEELRKDNTIEEEMKEVFDAKPELH